MSDASLEISIPLDKDGFIEMECDFCKGRFMIHQDVYSDERNLHFFCPLCGLPNRSNTFYCPEVLEAAKRKAQNYACDEIERQLGPTLRKFNKNGLVKMKLKVPKREPEKELFTPANDYVVSHQKCCGIDVKTLDLDAQIGLYCPICGGANL